MGDIYGVAHLPHSYVPVGAESITPTDRPRLDGARRGEIAPSNTGSIAAASTGRIAASPRPDLEV